MKLIDNKIVWYGAILLILLLPILLFGTPGYYNDDLHFFHSINKEGVVGMAISWLKSYGFAYRPVGIFMESGLYALLKNHIFLFYTFSVVCYWLFVVSSGRVVNALTQSERVEKYTTLFIAFFPFNATAFLQLSSTYMFIAAALSIILLGTLCYKCRPFKHQSTYLFLFFSWLFILLIYEQVLGFLVGFYLYAAFVYFSSNDRAIRKHILKIGGLLLVSSLLFMGAYVFSSKNPKVHVLRATYVHSVSQKAKPTLTPKATFVPKVNSARRKVHRANQHGFLAKVEKSLHFFSANFTYYYSASLKNNPASNFTFLFLIGVLAVALFRFEKKTISIKTAAGLSIIGVVVFLAGLLPFMLYHHVAIPVYCFVMPSFGLALLFCGVSVFIFNKFRYFLASIYLVVLIVFSVQQYAYYFGLKEELQYWSVVSSKAVSHLDRILGRTGYLLNGLPAKKNNHMFWLDKAIGYRVVSDVLFLHGIKVTHLKYDPSLNTVYIQGVKLT